MWMTKVISKISYDTVSRRHRDPENDKCEASQGESQQNRARAASNNGGQWQGQAVQKKREEKRTRDEQQQKEGYKEMVLQP